MVRVLRLHLATQTQIVSRVVSGKGSELFVEVRLIVELRMVCGLRPVDGLHRVKMIEHALEAEESRQFFRRPAREQFALRGQVILTDADVIAQRSNR